MNFLKTTNPCEVGLLERLPTRGERSKSGGRKTTRRMTGGKNLLAPYEKATKLQVEEETAEARRNPWTRGSQRILGRCCLALNGHPKDGADNSSTMTTNGLHGTGGLIWLKVLEKKAKLRALSDGNVAGASPTEGGQLVARAHGTKSKGTGGINLGTMHDRNGRARPIAKAMVTAFRRIPTFGPDKTPRRSGGAPELPISKKEC